MAVTTIMLKKNKTTVRENKDNPFFPVKMVGLTREDGPSVPNLKALVNEDTNEFIHEVSKNYKITTHQEASNLVKNFLLETEIPFESLGPQVSMKGSRFYETILFPDLTFNPISTSTALDGKGFHIDDLVPTITILNSYDKTSSVAWDYGMFRVKCKNGAAILEPQGRLSFRHNQTIDTEKVRSSLLSNLERSTTLISKLAEKLNSEDGSDFLMKLFQAGFSDGFKEKLFQAFLPHSNISFVDRVVDERTTREIESLSTQESAWAIYNVATEVATHEIGNRTARETESKRIAKIFGVVA